MQRSSGQHAADVARECRISACHEADFHASCSYSSDIECLPLSCRLLSYLLYGLGGHINL
jgi:hypothetical protein